MLSAATVPTKFRSRRMRCRLATRADEDRGSLASDDTRFTDCPLLHGGCTQTPLALLFDHRDRRSLAPAPNREAVRSVNQARPIFPPARSQLTGDRRKEPAGPKAAQLDFCVSLLSLGN